LAVIALALVARKMLAAKKEASPYGGLTTATEDDED